MGAELKADAQSVAGRIDTLFTADSVTWLAAN